MNPSGAAAHDADRSARIRRAVEACILRGVIPAVSTGRSYRAGREGAQMRLAEHFGVSRQRIAQVVRQVRESRI